MEQQQIQPIIGTPNTAAIAAGGAYLGEKIKAAHERSTQIKETIDVVLHDRPNFDPVAVESFMQIKDLAPERIDKLTSGIVVGGGVAALSGVMLGALCSIFPGLAETIRTALPTLPDTVHNAMQVLHGAALNSASTQNLLDHIVTLLQDGALFGVYSATIATVIKAGMLPKIGKAQEQLQEILKVGGVPSVEKPGGLERTKWQMHDGNTQFFGALGDPFAASLARNLGVGEVMFYTKEKPEFANVWTKFDDDATVEQIHDAFEAGCFKNSGEVVISSSNGQHLVFPGQADADFTPRQISTLVRTVRSEERAFNVEPKKIILLGDRTHKSVANTVDIDGVPVSGREVITSLDTIQERDSNVIVVDPTEIALQDVINKTGSSNFVFRGEPDSLDKYREQFYDRLTRMLYPDVEDFGARKVRYKEDSSDGALGDQVEVVYNISDDQTVQQVVDEESSVRRVSIILSEDAHQDLIRRGIKDEDIVFVPKLVDSRIKELVNQPNTPKED